MNAKRISEELVAKNWSPEAAEGFAPSIEKMSDALTEQGMSLEEQAGLFEDIASVLRNQDVIVSP